MKTINPISISTSHNNAYSLWFQMVKLIPVWVINTGILLAVISLSFALLTLVSQDGRFLYNAFERLKFKKKEVRRKLADCVYLEVTIPKNFQATAFQIQQKILKSLHSVYDDPIEGKHNFSNILYFFQKLYRYIKILRAKREFFVVQIFAQYPSVSFRLFVPAKFTDRIEKAIFNAYPGAEIADASADALAKDMSKFGQSYLSYGESTIEGKFWHRVKTFKDVSSDPVDSIVSMMEGLTRGQYMAYNIFVSPVSHYFNQIVHFLLDREEQKRTQQFSGFSSSRDPNVETSTEASGVASAITLAMLEKMKAPLFQVIVSYWAVSSTPEDAEAKIRNIQAVLNEINQKNMNSLKHRHLFTKQLEELEKSGELKNLIGAEPILRKKRYKNHGQIISDSELYSFWHLPNTVLRTAASIKTTKYKKLPASRDIREFGEKFFVHLGAPNFRMQESDNVGIATWEDMKRHVYILGGTGAGKSETLKRIVSELLTKDNDEKTACLIIDPKNDFATDLLSMIPEDRKDDVVYFNPAKQKERPLSFPFFSHVQGDKSDEERVDFLVSIMRRFVQIDSEYSWGPELENILRQLFATAYVLPEQSLSGIDLLLHEPAQIKNILKYLPARLQQFWSSSILKRTNNDLAKYLATTNNKLGKFLDYPEFMNIADRLDTKLTIDEIIRTKKIFIANLGSSSEQMKKYYSVYLTAQISEAIFRQANLPSEERQPAVFVIDEFQRVASDIFETLFSEVRAFNVSLVISNQFMGQLEPRIQKSIEANIATKIFMRTQSVDDAAIAEKILANNVTVEDMVNLPTGVAYFKTLVSGIPQEAMSIKIEQKKYPSDISKDIENFYTSQTMERYGTPQSVIKQKRDSANNIYYSPNRERVFSEQMARKKTYEPELDDTVNVDMPPSRPPSEGLFIGSKTIFDF